MQLLRATFGLISSQDRGNAGLTKLRQARPCIRIEVVVGEPAIPAFVLVLELTPFNVRRHMIEDVRNAETLADRGAKHRPEGQLRYPDKFCPDPPYARLVDQNLTDV